MGRSHIVTWKTKKGVVDESFICCTFTHVFITNFFLFKILQSYPKYHFIPKRISVCKRLSQCLHPALPSGVHLKALEVYTVLFQNIGVENLSRDLFLYSSGLFPLLENAALSVKPVLLNIYETYFLPLKHYLKPCLTGILIALLPGLEEGSDFFDRTYNLLQNICEQTAKEFFFTSIWSTMLFSQNIRFAAIQFILSYYDKKKSMEDQLFLIGRLFGLWKRFEPV
jgi:hypothetical protein